MVFILCISASTSLPMEDNGSADGRTQFAPTLSRILKQFKGSVTKQVGAPIWQKSFYDHVIRNEAEYLDTWAYIDENPAKWTEDDLFCPTP